jgi:protein-S-isoprenylcysteine O-methyltransferase Ste14
MEVAMKLVLMSLYLTCIVSFDWARRTYFKRTGATPNLRKGLRPLGTVLSLMNLVLLFLYAPDKWTVMSATAALTLVCSLALFFASLRSHDHVRPAIAFTPGPPERLTSRGAYRFIRHPIYSSYMLCWLGVAVAAPGLLTVGAAVIMSALYVKAARSEEDEIIKSPLGGEYTIYKASAGMFAPKVSALWLGAK